MNFDDAMVRSHSSQSAHYLVGYDHGLAGECVCGHRGVYAVVESLEGFDIVRTWVQHH
jgi:hypothetical protein